MVYLKIDFNAGNLKTALFIMGGLLFYWYCASFILLWLFVIQQKEGLALDRCQPFFLNRILYTVEKFK